ncbi:exosortase A [uncultured Desulfuromusa sp.]|uniref:exosortase A n=1 Tax=uncultured Desulfuromusa sp. TaxID=219183 RepID=UPI002AA71786|nr:exosortase A [uncultured Desulfuromusa sp.]
MTGDSFDLKKNRTTLSLLGFLVLAFIIVFYPTWQSLFQVWSSSDDYSHGFLIVPLCLYLLWQKREDLKHAAIKPSWVAFPLVLLSLFLYVVAQYAEILTLAPLAMILFLGSSTVFLFGVQVFKVCMFPLFLLLFMVPVPTQIYAALTIPLQLFVTKMTVYISSLIGIPILREGNVISLPEHTLQVVQACSGLRSIMSLLTLGVVIGYFGLKSNLLRTVLFVSAVPIAILVNIVRVLLMVIAFYYFNFDLAEGTIHTAFGAGIFGLSIVLFLLFREVLVLCEK